MQRKPFTPPYKARRLQREQRSRFSIPVDVDFGQRESIGLKRLYVNGTLIWSSEPRSAGDPQ